MVDPAALKLHELVGGDADHDGQRDAERRGPLKPLFDRDPADQHGREHEAGHDPVQPLCELSLVEHLQQEEHQAADQHHDQRRADGDHDIIGHGLVQSACHDRRVELSIA